MTSYVDLDYINRISPRLQNFKKKREYLFNFRCPVCGDSKKSKSKARAYLYRVKVDMFFKCHNCGASQNLANFIKSVDTHLHGQYILDKYKGGKPKVVKSSKFNMIVGKNIAIVNDFPGLTIDLKKKRFFF